MQCVCRDNSSPQLLFCKQAAAQEGQGHVWSHPVSRVLEGLSKSLPASKGTDQTEAQVATPLANSL